MQMGCSMAGGTTTGTQRASVVDWASSVLAELTREGERVLLIGPDVGLADGLGDDGREVSIGASPHPGDDSPPPDLTDAADGVDTVVLAGTLSWVRDEVGYLRGVLDALADGTRLVVVVPNVTWLPHRLSLLAGRSPFGGGPVAGRPLRFFARDTLLDALSAAGSGPVDLRAVAAAAGDTDGLAPELVTELRQLADADVIGFVAVVGSLATEPDDAAAVAAGPIRSAVRSSIGEGVRAEVRAQERRAVEHALAVASEVADLRSRLEELEHERDRLAPAAAELDAVRARLGYRALVRLERSASRIPFAMGVWRRVSGALRRGGRR
jgi:hypothetical protein